MVFLQSGKTSHSSRPGRGTELVPTACLEICLRGLRRQNESKMSLAVKEFAVSGRVPCGTTQILRAKYGDKEESDASLVHTVTV